MESFRKKLAVSVVIDCSRRKLNGEEKEIVEVKAGMSEEIERVKSASNTQGILLKAKQRARPSNRRRNIRVYIP